MKHLINLKYVMHNMRFSIFALFLLSLLSSQSIAQDVSSVDLKEDLHFFKEQYVKNHADPFNKISQKEFEKKVNS